MNRKSIILVFGTMASLASVLLAAKACLCSDNTDQSVDSVPTTRHFQTVEVPAMLDMEGKLEFAAGHFWDSFLEAEGDFLRDSSVMDGVALGEMEQAVSNYIMLLSNQSLQAAGRNLESLCDQLVARENSDSSSNAFEGLTRLLERYLYDPNSPLRDEDIYCFLAAKLSVCPLISKEKRESYAEDVRLCSLNVRGTRAADFLFTDRKGKHYSLYGIKADYIILFFSNPGCTACKEIIDALNGSPLVEAKLDTRELAILNIYIDEELDEWYKYMPIYSEKWYNGYDPNLVIRTEELYNVRAIPSLYFLDKDKKVIFKDVPLERLMENLPWNQDNL